MPMMGADPRAMMMMGRGLGSGENPGRAQFEAWQRAQAELEALKTTGAMADPWSPETRKYGKGTQYLVGDKWWDQQAWDDPSFQASVVDPYRQGLEKQASEAYQKKLADAMQRAEMARFDYEDYQRRMDEIRAGAQGAGGMRSTSTGPTNRMLGSGR